MEILFVTTELAPYVNVAAGLPASSHAEGLAEVSAALPKTLKMLGHKVTIVMPRFSAFEEAGLLLARRLTPLSIALGDRSFDVTIFDGRLSSQVDLVLLDAPGMFDRAGVYGERGEDYPDNATRFGLFARAAAELVKQRASAGSKAAVVHLNDWPTALVAKHLKELGVPTPTVLTIHDLGHQGVFPESELSNLGLTASDFSVDGAEFYGSVNVLKQGIVSADLVTTVSATYAEQIQTEAGGARLDGVLREKGRILGVVNGIDSSVWNPATDSNLVARFDAEDASHKARCKGALQKELGLALDPDVPLVASVGALVRQTGADLVAEVLPRLLRGSDAQIVIAGEGDAAIVAALEEAVKKAESAARERVVFARGAAQALVHRVFGAADLVLVPSRFEPCGRAQMIAQRYGAAPVAHATGGLVDTVVDCDAQLETGTGFLFDEPTADALFGAVQRGISAFESARWPVLRRRVMRLDHGWERAARKYEQAYKSLAR